MNRTRDAEIGSMSLEAAAVILGLLWGPTALWLIYRAVRGPTAGTREAFARAPARPRTEQGPLDAVLRNEYWICRDCRSVNHLGAMQCYSCGLKRPQPEPVAPEPAATPNGWVAVMDPAVGRRTSEPAVRTRAQPISSALPPDPPPAAPMPELAPGPAMVVAGAAAASRGTKRPRTARRPRTPAGGPTAAELSVLAHMTGAPPAAVAPAPSGPPPPEAPLQLPQFTPSIAPPVCPYLGFKDDPATQCSYPDDRNVCHAAAAEASSMPSPRRLVQGVRGRGRTLPISAEHQATLCLTTEHRQCDRFPAAHLPAAPNTTQ